MKSVIVLSLYLLFGTGKESSAQRLSPDFLREKFKEARILLEQHPARYYGSGKGKNFRPHTREIVLAVYSPVRDTVLAVRLEAPVSQKKNSFVFSVKTPGYRVERLSGRGVTRLVFDVADAAGEKMIVLDLRYLHFENRISPRDLFYAPYSDSFIQEDFILGGYDHLFRIIREAQDELCAADVQSRAYSGKRLCEVIPDMWFATLGLIEQTDNSEFFGRECVGHVGCDEVAIWKALVHIARNREQAFYYSVSEDGARGFMQFMNTRRIPTYRFVHTQYPEAFLEKDFEKGTADMKNSIKAAACLLDFNLSQLPPAVRAQFLENPKIGGAYGAAAHNGGAGSARRLYGAVAKQSSFNWSNFKAPRRTVLRETEGFIKKYIRTWDILQDIELWRN